MSFIALGSALTSSTALSMGASMAMGAASSASAASAGNRAKSIDYMNQMNQNKATNEAIAEANLKNTVRTGYRVGILAMQEGQARMEAAKNKTALGEQGLAALAKSHAVAAASGTVGSSVAAVSADIQKTVDEAGIEIQNQWDVQMFNFDTQLNDLIAAGQDSLKSAQTGPAAPDYADVSGAGVSGAMQAAGSFAATYAGAKMKLGLATPSPSTTVYPQSGGFMDRAGASVQSGLANISSFFK